MKYDVDKSGEIDQAEFKAMAFDFGMVQPPPEPPHSIRCITIHSVLYPTSKTTLVPVVASSS